MPRRNQEIAQPPIIDANSENATVSMVCPTKKSNQHGAATPKNKPMEIAERMSANPCRSGAKAAVAFMTRNPHAARAVTVTMAVRRKPNNAFLCRAASTQSATAILVLQITSAYEIPNAVVL